MIQADREVRQRKAGFTLIELIAVLAILEVLLAVAVPNTVKYIRSADRVASQTEAQIVADAVQTYLYDLKDAGELTAMKVHRLMGSEINDPDGILKDYVTGGRQDARVVSVNVNLNTGMLKKMVYENSEAKIRVTMDENGNRTVEDITE